MTTTARPSHRMVQVDALRGLAALAVVLFHYTTRFAELFPVDSAPTTWFSSGHYGVNLFFIISGFVIFMTLEKTARPMDFVVSRFSRLFPTYWAAIFLTFFITHLLGLPDKLVGVGTAVANMLMVHGLFRIPHVDGVYWTLEVELLFYCAMLLLYRMRWLERVHLVVWGLLVLRIAYFVLESQWGISLPWTIFRLLILQYVPWFALGISVYLGTHRHDSPSLRRTALTCALALATLWLCESATVAALAVAFTATVFLASKGQLVALGFGPFVWLGSISYPLYLLHENIGWALLLRLQALHVPMELAIVLTLCASFLLASALTHWIEQPAMHWLRRRYKARTRPGLA